MVHGLGPPVGGSSEGSRPNGDIVVDECLLSLEWFWRWISDNMKLTHVRVISLIFYINFTIVNIIFAHSFLEFLIQNQKQALSPNMKWN